MVEVHKTMLTNLAKIGKTIDSQVATGLPKADVLDAQFRTWAKRLASLQEDDAVTIAFSEAIVEGPWSSDQKRELGRILMERGSATEEKPKSAARRPMQKCERFENMLNQSDWANMRRPGAIKAYIISILASRAHKLGIVNASEKTLNRMVRILAYALGTEWTTEDDVKENKKLIASAIKHMEDKKQKAKRPFGYLANYPVSATELDATILAFAYHEEPLPVDVEIPELDAILGDAKMRSDDVQTILKSMPKKYQSKIAAVMNHDSQSRSSRAPSEVGPSPLQYVNEFEHSIGNQIFNQNRSRSCVPQERLPGFSKPAPQLASGTSANAKEEPYNPNAETLDLDEFDVPALGKVEEIPENLGDEDDIDEMEASLSVVGKTNPKKKPAGEAGMPCKKTKATAAATKTTTKGKKKKTKAAIPAAPISDAAKKIVGKCVALKRPSKYCPKIDMTDVHLKAVSDHQKTPLKRNAFQCRAYGAAKIRARNALYAEDKVNAFQKEHFAIASALYNELE